MKIFAVILVIVVVLLGILGPQVFYVVDETQTAIVTRFGELRGEIRTPGIYVKTPFVDSVTYFEKRLLIFDAPAESMLTKDKKNLRIDVYARGRIVDPLLFFRSVRSEARAASVVIPIVASELRLEIAKDDQIEVIQETRENIMNRIRDRVQPRILAEFGINITDVRIKRTDFPDTIAESVFARMRAERKRIADRDRAEGAQADAEIRSSVDRQATIILAESERDAAILRGEGEAEAIQIYAEALNQDPEFFTFQRSLEAYRKFLAQNTTMVLPADSDLFQFLESPRRKVESDGDEN